MDLSTIHFHDSRLRRVIEICDTHDMLFEVDYPVDWENNRFEPRVIAFRDVINYSIDEIPFHGAPCLDTVDNKGPVGARWHLQIHTNAGTRTLLCADIELIAPA